jgi:rRNA maturation RNase YbeY
MIYFKALDVELPDSLGMFEKDWIAQVIQHFGKKTGEVFFLFCSDEYLLQMNKDFLQHDTFTDIITFDLSESNKYIAGEIFISVDRVSENSQKFNVSFSEELHRVLIHGILHLLGFKDKTGEESALMREQENFCLSLRP